MVSHALRRFGAIALVLALGGCHKISNSLSHTTYSSSQYGYSFKYQPLSWTLDAAAPSMVSVHRETPDPLHPGGNLTVTSVSVQHIDNPKHLELQALYSTLNADEDRALARVGAPAKEFTAMRFANQPALKIATPGVPSSKIYVWASDGRVLDISLDVLGDERDTQYLAEARAIVASIKVQ